MTHNTIMRHLASTLGFAGVLLLSACGEDTVVQPRFGSACSEGTLSAGQRVLGAFTTESCTVPNHWWSYESSPYASYRVSLERGKGYWFYLQAVNADGLDDVDPVLSLIGLDKDGNSIPLAVSDGEADGNNSEFYFVAPRSGTFSLVASSYYPDDLGGYLLQMEQCPVVSVIAGEGTFENLPFRESNCVRHSLGTSRIVLLAIDAEPFEDVDVTVTSTDFTPFAELGGPGFDVFDEIYEGSFESSTSAVPALVGGTLGAVGGRLTLAVGATDVDVPSGEFTVLVNRTPGVAPLTAAAATDGVMTLRSAFNVDKKQR